ncbi:MAG: glycosyltransferase [Microthrixaceae bacterium]
MIDLTVITATIPERALMLAELAAALDVQTERPEWLIEVDEDGDGPVPHLNRLAEKVDTEWIFRLDDDDLVDPDHFEILADYLTDDYDVVYSWPADHPRPPRISPRTACRSSCRCAPWRPQLHCVRCSVRTSLWCELGEHDVAEEDHDLWIRAYPRERTVPVCAAGDVDVPDG